MSKRKLQAMVEKWVDKDEQKQAKKRLVQVQNLLKAEPDLLAPTLTALKTGLLKKAEVAQPLQFPHCVNRLALVSIGVIQETLVAMDDNITKGMLLALKKDHGKDELLKLMLYAVGTDKAEKVDLRVVQEWKEAMLSRHARLGRPLSKLTFTGHRVAWEQRGVWVLKARDNGTVFAQHVLDTQVDFQVGLAVSMEWVFKENWSWSDARLESPDGHIALPMKKQMGQAALDYHDQQLQLPKGLREDSRQPLAGAQPARPSGSPFGSPQRTPAKRISPKGSPKKTGEKLVPGKALESTKLAPPS